MDQGYTALGVSPKEVTMLQGADVLHPNGELSCALPFILPRN
jgi:hypothetical protein